MAQYRLHELHSIQGYAVHEQCMLGKLNNDIAQLHGVLNSPWPVWLILYIPQVPMPATPEQRSVLSAHQDTAASKLTNCIYNTE